MTVSKGCAGALVVGEGRPLLLCGGFAMAPWIYRRTASYLSADCRVLVPDLFDVGGAWTYEKALEGAVRLLDRHAAERVSLCAHSFGGALAVDIAARYPDRVADLVFSDTLAVCTRWRLATEAVSGMPRLYQLASASAAASFMQSWLRHPAALVRAAWWAFASTRDKEIDRIRELGIPSTVLWATRDVLLSRDDGRRFAEQLGGRFRLVGYPDGTDTDHDWVFNDAGLFADTVRSLDLWALSKESAAAEAEL